jgi:hypothetical protein
LAGKFLTKVGVLFKVIKSVDFCSFFIGIIAGLYVFFAVFSYKNVLFCSKKSI